MSESEEDFEEPSYDPFGSDHSSQKTFVRAAKSEEPIILTCKM